MRVKKGDEEEKRERKKKLQVHETGLVINVAAKVSEFSIAYACIELTLIIPLHPRRAHWLPTDIMKFGLICITS